MLPGLGMVIIASLGLFFYWTINSPQAAFYLMPSRIWQLSLGAMVHLSYLDNPSHRNRLAQSFDKVPGFITLGTGLILIIGSAITFDATLAYPGFRTLVSSFGAAFIIVASHTLRKDQNSPLAHPILVWLGDRSYSLYLWHWPIFILGFSLGFQDQAFPILTMILLTLLAANLSFRLIELPFWKGRWSRAKPLRIILLSLLVMTISILAMNYGLRQLPQPDSSTDISYRWRLDRPEIYPMACDAMNRHSRVEPCVFGTETARRTVVFLGDSIGLQWFSMIPEIYPEPLWRSIVLTKSSCAIVDEDYLHPRTGKIYQICTDWRNAILDELDILKPDVLIIGSAATYDFSETQWLEGSSKVFERVSKSAAAVFVIPGTPSLGFDGPGCVSRNVSPDGLIDRINCLAKDRLKHIEPVTKFLGQAANRFANVYMLNLNDLVCPDGDCNAISEEGLVVFRDSQHLTDTFVRVQAPFIHERLKRLYRD
jgi:hypothetical protein